MMSFGGGPSALYSRVTQRHVHLIASAALGPAEQAGVALTRSIEIGRQWWHLVLLEHLLDPVRQLVRDQLAKHPCVDHARVRVGLAEALLLADVAGGHHGVDPVRLVADVLVDPLELDLELLG
jgi:hypothetical protein